MDPSALAVELHLSRISAPLAAILYKQFSQSRQTLSSIKPADWQSAVKTFHKHFPQYRGSQKSLSSFPHWRERFAKIHEQYREFTAEIQSSFFLYGSFHYPKTLYQIPSPPFLLFYQGEASVLRTPGFSICGSRKASLKALAEAFYLAFQISAVTKFPLISGLTEGIELAACEGVLQAQQTVYPAPIVGVLSSGLQAVQPLSARQTARRIVQAGGILLSQYLDCQVSQSFAFSQRNQILTALTKSVIMTEMRAKSKSRNIIQHALDHNRDIAVIGDSPGARELLEEGCPHWRNAAELLQALGLRSDQTKPAYLPDLWRQGPIAKQISQNTRQELAGKAIRYRHCLIPIY